MLLHLVATCLLLAPQEPPAPDPPTAKQVADTLADLDRAYGTKDLKEIEGALERAREVPHAKVVKAIRKGLKNDAKEVRQATVQSLRWNEHADALEELHKLAGNRKWMGDEEYAAGILKAIGQHADPSSLKILAADPSRTPYRDATRARILGLGRIRQVESVEALIELMATAGRGNGKRMYRGYVDDFRLSLILLTGTDQGKSPELWERWWRTNKKTFRMAPKAIELPREERYRWYNYWGLGTAYERKERREDRGT